MELKEEQILLIVMLSFYPRHIVSEIQVVKLIYHVAISDKES